MEITEAIRNMRSKQEQRPSTGYSPGLAKLGAKRLDTEILKVFTPDLQGTLCKNSEECLFGDYPTLAGLNKKYGNDSATAWLIPQITDCVAFTNNRGVLDDGQTESLASLIASEYYYLKVSELMLFFRRFKLGRYRQIYGNFSPMAITLSIREFLLERNNACFKHEAEMEAKNQEKGMMGTITYKEYLKLKHNK